MPETIILVVVYITLTHSMFFVYFHTSVNIEKNIINILCLMASLFIEGATFLGHGMKN